MGFKLIDLRLKVFYLNFQVHIVGFTLLDNCIKVFCLGQQIKLELRHHSFFIRHAHIILLFTDSELFLLSNSISFQLSHSFLIGNVSGCLCPGLVQSLFHGLLDLLVYSSQSSSIPFQIFGVFQILNIPFLGCIYTFLNMFVSLELFSLIFK